MRVLALVAACPYLDALRAQQASLDPVVPAPGYAAALRALDLRAVQRDLRALFVDSKDWWPADFGNYGPFFVRLAWHCSGSYRTSDGRGGCDGGRQRFEPERSWADNTNLDKARRLLWPLKEKYGLGLSWGDLFILAGTTAIESMGGPVLGFCAGRIDAQDGSESAELGPDNEVQYAHGGTWGGYEKLFPCPVNGECKKPLGSTTVGLIYLNPEGPMGIPDPVGSSKDIRDAFGRMAMNDTETVALIGGGHAFGKTHGACPKGAGPAPKDDPANPWPGLCGTGKGTDAFTSGFEGPWTTTPTRWSNEFFTGLLGNEWEVAVGPGGHHQWHAAGATGKMAGVMRLTSDIGLLRDPKYLEIVKTYAADLGAFDNAFKHAWYKLTTRDMGPVTRCVGDDVPSAQPFQYPLPPAPEHLADFDKVRFELQQLISSPAEGTLSAAPLFARLAWQCTTTFRQTDRQGGCNGARIRHEPERSWPVNAGLDAALALLAPVQARFGGLSWADLIVLAGSTALEAAGVGGLPFCGGRTDAADGVGSENLGERFTGAESLLQLKYDVGTLGLSLREMTALAGIKAIPGFFLPGYQGYTDDAAPGPPHPPAKLTNGFFKALFDQKWEPYTTGKFGAKPQLKAADADLYLVPTDYLLRTDPELAAIAHDYASDNALYLSDLASAWTKLTNADRFMGPTGNICYDAQPQAPAPVVV